MRLWWASVLGVLLLGSFFTGGWAIRQFAPVPQAGHMSDPRGGKATTTQESAALPGSSVAYRSLPNFSAYKDIRERKRAFFNYLLPLVETANQHIQEERQRVITLKSRQHALSESDLEALQRLARKYRVPFEPENPAFWDQLLTRIDVLPPSLVLAQAAIESAWGTSRFAVEGNNLFGVWCFRPGCGLPPLRRDADKSHEVRVYTDVLSAVEDYMLNLNRHSHYETLRQLRARLRAQGQPVTGTLLASALERYSEKGDEYPLLVTGIIRQNRLERFDLAPRDQRAEG